MTVTVGEEELRAATLPCGCVAFEIAPGVWTTHTRCDGSQRLPEQEGNLHFIIAVREAGLEEEK